MLRLRDAAGSAEANRYRQALEHLFADPAAGDDSPDSPAERPDAL